MSTLVYGIYMASYPLMHGSGVLYFILGISLKLLKEMPTTDKSGYFTLEYGVDNQHIAEILI